MRRRKCRECREWFMPERNGQACCSAECAMKYVDIIKKKDLSKQKIEHRKNDKSFMLSKAQKVFNRYIRKRDGNRCITCGATNRQIHAGHYLSQGNNSMLRFEERNCHSQCSVCNTHLSGNLAIYRDVMIAKYGVDVVEELESRRSPKKWSIEELKEIIELYTKKYNELQNDNL